MKGLKKKFPDYESFKDASMDVIFTQEDLDTSNQLKATTLSSIVLINNGNMEFDVLELPVEAQFSSIYAINTADFDNDGDQDIVLGGNLFNVKPEVGRYDATYGVYLENEGNMKFKSYKNGNGFFVKGEVRDLIIHERKLIVARNSDSLAVFKY